jgi:signal transduction histidine kinase
MSAESRRCARPAGDRALLPVARAVALLALAAVCAGVVLGLAYGAREGIVMTLFLAASGGPAIVGAHLLARRRAVAGRLAQQFATGIGLTVGAVTVGVGAVALAMFISPHDALVMAILLIFAGGLTTYAAWVLARGVLRDVEAVRDGVRAVGEGEREIQIRTGARDELAELAGAANRMTGQLAEREAERDAADGARRDLIAAISHDLRTPLTSLRLLAGAVEDDLVDRETRERYLGQMSGHLASLSALIDDLFELSRLEAGDIQWSMRQVALDELVLDTVEAMRPQAAEHGVAVAAMLDGPVAAARANPEQLQRVLRNLIHNAIRHTPADGSVTVAAQSNGGSVEVEVADTGTGVPTEERGRVFEPFYRGDNGARGGEGSGLGLAICRAIVEAHGGEIWLAGSSAGARVRFSLPAVG